MSFDGISKVPYTDANRISAYEAEKLKKKPTIPSIHDSDRINAVHKEHQQHHDSEDDEPEEGLTPEEQEQILLFAKLRGILNFSLEKGILYRFQINEQTGMIDLVELPAGKVKLTLTPDELAQVFAKLERYAGHMTNKSA